MRLRSSIRLGCILIGLLIFPLGCFLQKDPEEINDRPMLSERSRHKRGFIEGVGLIGTFISIISELDGFFQKDFNLFSKDKDKTESKLKSITQRLDTLESNVAGYESSLIYFKAGLPELLNLQNALKDIDDCSVHIHNQFKYFVQFMSGDSKFENDTLLNFAKSIVSHESNSIQSYMAKLNSIVTNEKDHQFPRSYLQQGIFQMVQTSLKSNGICHQQLSSQQIIFSLYAMISLLQTRGYVMQNCAYHILRYLYKGNYITESETATERHWNYIQALIEVTKKVLPIVENSFRKCDPIKHVEGETFVMMTELLQGYVVNESDMALDSCSGNCEYYTETSLQDVVYYQEDQTSQCKGELYDCRFFSSQLDICISSFQHRRYNWIKYDDSILGKDSKDCSSQILAESWTRGFSACNYCLCACDDDESRTSDRFISTRASVSNVEENKVVTGVKFVKKNQILYMMIQEGKAIAEGNVDQATLHWVEHKRSSKNDGHSLEYIRLHYGLRRFNLDLIKAPPNHVVTGLRFQKFKKHIYLEMQVTPINFATGKLKPGFSHWIQKDDAEISPPKELVLEDPDDPTKSTEESVVDSTSNMYVTFQSSSVEKDVAQLTVPFFDAQPVAQDQASWLEGVQLYHKGMQGYGGFVAFQIFTYDMSNVLNNLRVPSGRSLTDMPNRVPAISYNNSPKLSQIHFWSPGYAVIVVFILLIFRV